MTLASRYHRVDGIRVYCIGKGQGVPVLLVHGYLTSHRCWDQVFGALAEHAAVYAPDLPGFGESDRPRHFSYSIDAYAGTLTGLMDLLGLSSAMVIGHSLGGAVAMALASANPERVTRLVAVAPTVYPLEMPLWGRISLLPILGEQIFKRIFTRHALRRFFRRHVYLDPRLPSEEMLAFYWERLNRPGGREAAYHILGALSRLEALGNLPRRVECPTLLLWGEQDRLVPPDDGRRLASELLQAELVIIPGAGHGVMEERPRTFCQQVIPFLRGSR